jgi:hypothetical protein
MQTFYVVNVVEGYLDSYSTKDFIEFLNEGVNPRLNLALKSLGLGWSYYNSNDYKVFTDYKSAKETLIAVENQLECV